MLFLTTAELTDNRRFASPITPWQRGCEDAAYEQTYANPYPRGTADWSNYDAAFRQATTLCRCAVAATVRPRVVYQ